ncbi:MAG: ABC transporter permease [Phycisphaerae bacterium]|nr:ABC transporter permease [Phycisphaerae bacterium]
MKVQRVVAVWRKEWREILRDRLFFYLAFIVPTVQMLVIAYGVSLDVEDVPVAIVDYDRSRLSREYVHKFIDSRYFDFKGCIDHEDEIDDLLTDNRIRAAIIIPEHFEQRLLEGRSAPVQTLIDGTFPYRAELTKGYVIAINANLSREMLAGYLSSRLGIAPHRADDFVQPIRLEVRYLYNQAVRSIWSLAPSIMMLVLMMTPPLLTAVGVVREKESGSIYNIYASTVTRGEFLVGKLAPYVVISSINVIILWLWATHLFDVPFKGNKPVFFLISVLYVTCTTMVGLIVSLLVRTQIAATIIATIIAMVPTILFAGIFVPVPSLSRAARVQSQILPATHYNDIARGFFLKGMGAGELWLPVAVLVAYAAGLFALGYVLFRKRVAA